MIPARTHAMTNAAAKAMTNGRNARGEPMLSCIPAFATPAAAIHGFASTEYHSAPSIQAATAAISTAQ